MNITIYDDYGLIKCHLTKVCRVVVTDKKELKVWYKISDATTALGYDDDNYNWYEIGDK